MSKLISAYAKRIQYKAKVYSRFTLDSLFPKQQQKIIDAFHKLFYDSNIIGKTWNDSYFLGTGIQKCPLDLFIYQEILFDVKPDIIIETGTKFGGSAHYLAVLCDALKKGEIITVDITPEKNMPKHKRIKYLVGSSIDSEILKTIKGRIKKGNKVLVILDSDHSKDHVLKELKIYNKFVTKGSYMIVEDSNVNGHPVNKEHGPGPMEAIEAFMKEEGKKQFVIDKSREKFYVTFNPNGYLKKTA
ncbi:MAG: CmcI family methyltransferase [Patescibacteria group bacterium]